MLRASLEKLEKGQQHREKLQQFSLKKQGGSRDPKNGKVLYIRRVSLEAFISTIILYFFLFNFEISLKDSVLALYPGVQHVVAT